MATQTKPSSSWAISASAALGGSKGKPGVGMVALTLFDVESQLYFSMTVYGGSLGGGIPVGATVSTFSPSFFTTPTAMWAKDFDGRMVSIAGAELSVIAGGSAMFLTFLRISTQPSWLDIGGVEAGLAAGVGGGVYYSSVAYDAGWANKGCRIQPDGDPLCGGKSPSPQYSTENPNVSTQP